MSDADIRLRGTVHVRPYRDDDLSSVLDLLDVTLGGGPGGRRTEDFFRWKHLENPMGRSFMLVAESEGTIVGFRAFMRWRFLWQGTELRAVRAVDTATHPDHQGKGIFSRLTLQALDALRTETDLVFNTPNSSSLPGYLKMGWRTLGPVPVWIRVRRPLAFARGLRSVRSAAEPPSAAPEVRAPQAADALRDRSAVVDLLHDVEVPGDRIATPLDHDHLDWRYGRAPLLGYRAITEEAGGRLSGIAFFRVRPRGALWETTIGDVLVRTGDRRTARRLIGRVSTAAGVHHVTCQFPAGSVALAGARRHGFLRWPRGEVLVVNSLRPQLAAALERPESWGVSLGTLEVF